MVYYFLSLVGINKVKNVFFFCQYYNLFISKFIIFMSWFLFLIYIMFSLLYVLLIHNILLHLFMYIFLDIFSLFILLVI